jgi:outer membrane protein TolC
LRVAQSSSFALPAAILALWAAGCTAAYYRGEADRRAYDIITKKQAEGLGRTEPFTIETPAETLRRRLLLDQHLPRATSASLGTRHIAPIKQWPDPDYLKPRAPEDESITSVPTDAPLPLKLPDALQIAAHESREYQAQKESVFRVALQLDLERDAFRRTWSGVLTSLFQSNLEQQVALDDKGHTDLQTVSGFENDGVLELSQRLKNGLTFTGAIGLDLVSLMTQDRLYSRGIYADVSATLPLMRGASEFVVTEPLTQAERNVVYELYAFEHFKHTFAVDVASEYLGVLQLRDQVQNAEDNYRSLTGSTRRARRLADAGRLPEIQVDQSRQDELRARQRWVAALEQYQRRLDAFKVTLGLPADAAIELDHSELDQLVERAASEFPAEEAGDAGGPPPAADAPVQLVPPGAGQTGPYELDVGEAIIMALEHRLDLRVAVGRVQDAQRTVAVAADQLQADVTLLGTGAAGSRRTLAGVAQKDAILRPDEGSYSVLLTLDLPLERTMERNTYRSSLIGLEESVRGVQDLEDQIKLAVRNRLSELLEARESIRIQAAAVTVAKRRVESTNLFLEAGRAEIRDVLEAQDALISAQNALTSALVSYRLGELALQRDLGVLSVNEQGLWQEYVPERRGNQDAPENQ